jgi:hypothetical protein
MRNVRFGLALALTLALAHSGPAYSQEKRLRGQPNGASSEGQKDSVQFEDKTEVHSNPSGVQRGGFELEVEKPAEDSYSVTQEKVLKFLKGTLDRANALGRGEAAVAPGPVNDKMIQYLNAAYLYCTANSGTCPSLLQAILEHETINSRLAKKAECPTMMRFWKFWVDTDMERRQQYMVRTGFINATSEFKSKIRPKFIKCAETISSEISGNTSDPEYFRARYSKDSPAVKSLTEAIQIAEHIKEKVPNIFGAVGVSR